MPTTSVSKLQIRVYLEELNNLTEKKLTWPNFTH